ncbi:hypothetical protein K7432_011492 [Basidiobolus ranarum]|uniref:Uncharacterized protein n=1 Tax=Basidiobolus ranarum TaxID=34480 RepID=A0ABR2WM77_9FUNG
MMIALLLHKPLKPLQFMVDSLTRFQARIDSNFLDLSENFFEFAQQISTKNPHSDQHNPGNSSLSIRYTSETDFNLEYTQDKVNHSNPVETKRKIDDLEEKSSENEHFPSLHKKLSARFHRTQITTNTPYNRGRRGSVSAESMKPSEEDYARVVIPKSNRAKIRIASATSSNLLFKNLKKDQMQEIASIEII